MSKVTSATLHDENVVDSVEEMGDHELLVFVDALWHIAPDAVRQAYDAVQSDEVVRAYGYSVRTCGVCR